MNWYQWLIVIIPVSFVICMALYSHRYAQSVADYLVAGRVAGRYVLNAAGLMDMLAVISLVAGCEANYQTGFAMGYWGNILMPLGLFLGFFGYVTVRFRETRAMSAGQFLEMRYSRSFRIFATIVRVFGEMLTNCIGPAVAARFFIYLLGVPHRFHLFGVLVPTFPFILAVCISLALVVILSGGRISLIVADAIQGIIAYPVFVILAVFIFTEFSWAGQIAATMGDRVAGESFLNPYDISKLRDFNMFALVASVVGRFFPGAWIGNDHSGAGKTPHEQKMAGILGNWRGGLSYVMTTLLVLAVITVMNNADFKENAFVVRQELSAKVVDEIATPEAIGTAESAVAFKAAADATIRSIPVQEHIIGVDAPFSRQNNLDTEYQDAIHASFKEAIPDSEGHANQLFQNFRSLYNQMMLPMVMRHFFPPALMALFVMLMILMMISTDDSRIYNSATAIVQDLIVPFCRKPLTPRVHLFLIKLMTVAVCVVFFFASIFLSQLDYINLFLTISVAIWTAGGGVVVTLGLYWRRGTTAGAFASVISGGGTALLGIILQRNWADTIYPWLADHGFADRVRRALEAASRPFNPWIDWRVADEAFKVKFPVNATEISFIAMVIALVAYVVVSLLTCRKPFNLERLLHRGIYNVNPDKVEIKKAAFTWRRVLNMFVNITPDYTLGDKIITWSVFIYAIIYKFCFAFLGVVIWNAMSPWSHSAWATYFLWVSLIVPAIAGVVTTVWFMWGGIKDIRGLFRCLEERKRDALDNGMVEGHVSLVDREIFAERESEARAAEPAKPAE